MADAFCGRSGPLPLHARINGPRGMLLGLAVALVCYLPRALLPPEWETAGHLFLTVLLMAGGYFLGLWYGQLQLMSLTDPLTGVYNRHFFFPETERQLALAKRHSHPLSLVLIDLDSFKEFNDTHGHLAGDRLLRSLAAYLRNNLRSSDIVARLGGDEFVLLLPHTDRASARRLVERIWSDLADSAIVPVEFSTGVASFPEDGDTADHLLRRADEAMYSMKRTGKASDGLGTSARHPACGRAKPSYPGKLPTDG